MKLVIASGVLASALPTLSQTSANLIPRDDHASIAKSVPWTDKDSDISSVKPLEKRRRQRSQVLQANLHSTRMGLLTNQRRRVNKQDTNKYCNPVSQDPDVGILSCGPGMFCQSSKDSLLGGRCEFNEGHNMGLRKGGNGYGKDGLLKNINSIAGSFNGVGRTVECDPGTAADTGILSCGDGEHCVASSLSAMGGFCMPSVESRQLQGQIFGICNPTSNYYMYMNCDCSGYDVSSGSGEVPCITKENYCLGLSFPGCRYTCETRTVRYQVTNTTVQAVSVCSNFSSSATTTETFCYGETYASGTCAVSINSQACTSCAVVPFNGPYGSGTYLSFDCTNLGGVEGTTLQNRNDFVPSIRACYAPPPNTNCKLCTTEGTVMASSAFGNVVTVGDLGDFSCVALQANEYKYGPISENYCAAAAAAASEACCDSMCNLCGEGTYIPSGNFPTIVNFTLPGLQTVTCGDLFYSATVSFAVTGMNCQAASQVAQTSCCAPFAYEMCNVCDGPVVNPYPIVTAGGFSVPCEILDIIRNDTVCDAMKPEAIPICCTGGINASSPSPSAISDPAPVPTAPVAPPIATPEDSPSPEAPSGTSTQFPVTSILSTLGLLAVGLTIAMN